MNFLKILSATFVFFHSMWTWKSTLNLKEFCYRTLSEPNDPAKLLGILYEQTY